MGSTLHETLHNETEGNLIFIPNYSLTHVVMSRFSTCELEPELGDAVSCPWMGLRKSCADPDSEQQFHPVGMS